MTSHKWRLSYEHVLLFLEDVLLICPVKIDRWLKRLISYGSLQFFQSTWLFFVTFAHREKSHMDRLGELGGHAISLHRAITCSENNARTLAVEYWAVIEVAPFFWNHTWPMLISRLAKFRHYKFCNHIQVSILKNHNLINFISL